MSGLVFGLFPWGDFGCVGVLRLLLWWFVVAAGEFAYLLIVLLLSCFIVFGVVVDFP